MNVKVAVMPAQAGIQEKAAFLGPGLRRSDDEEAS